MDPVLGEHARSADLEETFFLSDQTTKTCRLTLSSDTLSITLPDGSSTRIAIEDIYGCLCMKALKSSVQCHLVVYLYVLRRAHGIGGFFSKQPTMHRSQKVFTFDKYDDYERNFTEVVRWHRLLNQAIYAKRNLPCKRRRIQRWAEEERWLLSVDIVRTKRDKRALVLVNPAGGAGKAYRLVMEYVVGVWSEAEFPYQIMITGLCSVQGNASRWFSLDLVEYAGHARDFVQSLDLSEWSGIVIASGDGLIYEVPNR